MKKKLWLLIAVLMCAVMALTASAEGEDDYTYIVLNNKATITDVVTSISGDIVIPETLGGYPVTAIGNNAFESCTNITSVTVHDGIQKIGNYAFRNCTKMTAISLPYGITSIGTYTFYGCSALADVSLPDSITSIGSYAFSSCSVLPTVVIPEGVTSIENSTFTNCKKLSNVSLPNSLTSIKDYAFYGCNSLNNITLPDNLTSIGNYAFYTCSGLKSLTLPNSLTSIGSYAFLDCKGLTGIAIPDSVSSIGDYALHYYYYNSSYNYGYSRLSNLTIYGYTGSYAETYANKHSIPFFSLGDVAEPVFTTDLADAVYFTGDSVTLTVLADAASAGTITYQWYVSDTPDGEFTAIEGATGTSYDLPTETASVKYYYVIAVNTNGTHIASTKSNTAKITVASGISAEAPEIFAQTYSTSCEIGEDIALFVSASVSDGGTLTYQWYVCDTPDGDFEPINGAVSAGYKPSVNTTGTLYYYVVITNINTGASGEKTASVQSELMSVTVGGEPLYTITGSLITYGDAADVTVRLLSDGEIIKTVTVKNSTGSDSYTIPDVAPGNYTIEVSKPNHVTREYDVTIQ